MLDIVLVVENLENFHADNLARNSSDYSFKWRSKFSTLEDICDLQRSKGNKVWWHPFVKDVLPNGQLLKYGVIEMPDFENDMTNWSDLYVAGRLHKPVKKFYRQKVKQSYIDSLFFNNRMGALNTALLTLPEEFTERDLYVKIANISYEGDSRFKNSRDSNTGSSDRASSGLVGKVLPNLEDRKKVENIVDGSYKEFTMIYRNLLYEYDIAKLNIDFDQHGEILKIQQDLSSKTILKKLSNCPLNLQTTIAELASQHELQIRDTEEVLRTVARHPMPMDYVNSALREIVSKKSADSARLSFHSAGISRSLQYGWEKYKKGRKN